MKKSQFVEYTTKHDLSLNGSFHADCVIYFEGNDLGTLIILSNGKTIHAANPYEYFHEKITELV